ncbi:hypothetical protein [Saccharopolyspora sp. NPDC049357]|uniref:hypothetical protein n=1 Tax=Saccharopolyspora sp. NPDC049357 TaxID=3154507 RepID=UPI003427DF2D
MTSPGQPFGQSQQHGYSAQQGYPQYPQGYPQPPHAQAPPPFVQQTPPGNDGLRMTSAILNIVVGIYLAVAGVLIIDSVINMTNEDDDYISVTGVALRLSGSFAFIAAAVLLIIGAVFLLRKRRAGSTLTWIGCALALLAFVLDSTGNIVWSMEFAKNDPYLPEKSFAELLEQIRSTTIIAAIVAVIPFIFALIPSIKRGLR